jgi:hypothetical protein
MSAGRLLRHIFLAYSYDDYSGDTSLAQFSVNTSVSVLARYHRHVSLLITTQPGYLYTTIKDIQSINSILKVYILPWSPVRVLCSVRGILQPNYLPARVDEERRNHGRRFAPVAIRAELRGKPASSPELRVTSDQQHQNYLLKSVQGFANKGITPYAISIQVPTLARVMLTPLIRPTE